MRRGHVRRIGEQGERIGDDAADDLRDEIVAVRPNASANLGTAVPSDRVAEQAVRVIVVVRMAVVIPVQMAVRVRTRGHASGQMPVPSAPEATL